MTPESWEWMQQRSLLIHTSERYEDGLEAARNRLKWIGEAIANGEDLPDKAREWLANALTDIANNEGNKANTANQILGLKRPNKRPIDFERAKSYAMDMEYLTQKGYTQEAAALIVAEKYRKSEETKSDIIKCYNALKNGKSPFFGYKVNTYLYRNVVKIKVMKRAPWSLVGGRLNKDGFYLTQEDEDSILNRLFMYMYSQAYDYVEIIAQGFHSGMIYSDRILPFKMKNHKQLKALEKRPQF